MTTIDTILILYVVAIALTGVYIAASFEWMEGSEPTLLDKIAATIRLSFCCLLWPIFWTSQLLTEDQ